MGLLICMNDEAKAVPTNPQKYVIGTVITNNLQNACFQVPLNTEDS